MEIENMVIDFSLVSHTRTHTHTHVYVYEMRVSVLEMSHPQSRPITVT